MAPETEGMLSAILAEKHKPEDDDGMAEMQEKLGPPDDDEDETDGDEDMAEDEEDDEDE